VRSCWHIAAIAVAGLALAPELAVPSTGQVPGRSGGALTCTPSALASVRLPGPVAIDGVRVVVAHHSPRSGAVNVHVGAGAFDRVVRVRGASSKALAFYPAMTASEFDVVLDPVFDAPADACVDRIELLRGGVPVAVVRP
jgi:hypothetical protein